MQRFSKRRFPAGASAVVIVGGGDPTATSLSGGGVGTDDTKDRVSSLRRSRGAGGPASVSSLASRGGDPLGATPRAARPGPGRRDADDLFNEAHADLGARRRPWPPGEMDADDAEFDRQFHLAGNDEYLPDAERASSNDASGNAARGRFIFESARTRTQEEEMELRRAAGHPYGGTRSGGEARKSALDRDKRMWEESRLFAWSAAVRSEVDLEFGNDDDARVQLLVHQIRPPFLQEGRGASFSTVQR